MTDRELMQQALDALEEYTNVVTSVNDPNSWVTVADGGRPAREAITALRERLAQPNDFNPDWDAMAVMVEEQQRMAKRIAELEAQPERIQLTVRDFVVTVGDIEDAVGTPMYWAEWPNKEQP